VTTDRNPTQYIATALIDPPVLPMRMKFDDEKFAELVESIRARGLRSAIQVYVDGTRYRVIAGHRRLEACKVVGLAEIECKVVTDAEELHEALKIDENYRRENVNAAEEAEYLHALYETRCGDDIEALARMTGLSFSYLSERINLHLGDARIRAAVLDDHVGVGVAGELNRIKSPASRFAALDTAVRYGCTVKQARELRTQANLQFERDEAARNGQPAPAAVPTSPASVGPLCVLCETTKDPHELELIYVHSYCRKVNLEPILDQLNGRTHAS
jgi:ParB family chromosome partitioning protein